MLTIGSGTDVHPIAFPLAIPILDLNVVGQLQTEQGPRRRLSTALLGRPGRFRLVSNLDRSTFEGVTEELGLPLDVVRIESLHLEASLFDAF